MQKILQLLFISATLSSLFAQDVWGGVSVATPDNLNAISGNPAGLGIERGEQSGYIFNLIHFIPIQHLIEVMGLALILHIIDFLMVFLTRLMGISALDWLFSQTPMLVLSGINTISLILAYFTAR